MSIQDQEVYLEQQIEFLNLQLEDAIMREKNLQKINDSLIDALNKTDRNPLHVNFKQEQALSELEKANMQQAKEIKEAARKFEKERTRLSQEVQQAALDIRQLKISNEAEKMQLRNQIQDLEMQIFDQEQQLESKETQIRNLSENQQYYQYDKDMQLNELQQKYDQEIQQLQNQITGLKDRLKSERAYRQQLMSENAKLSKQVRKQDLSSFYNNRDEINELKAGISQAKDTEKLLREQLSTKDRMLAEMRREFKKIHSARKQRVPTKIKIASSPNKPSIFKNSSEGATVRRAENGNDDSQDYCKKIYRLKNQLQKLEQQKSETQNELKNVMIELKQERSIQSQSMRLGDEGELKKEINYLIGRLLKAKNKLIDENTLTDTLKKDVESIRSRSVNKNVLGIRNSDSRSLNQLNLSNITHVDNSFQISDIDIGL